MTAGLRDSPPPMPFTRTLWKLLKALRPYWRPFVGGNALVLVATACEFYHYNLLGDAIDQIVNLFKSEETPAGGALTVIWPFVAIWAAIYVIRLWSYLRGMIMQRDCNMALLGDIRRKFYDYTQKLAFSFHDTSHPGKVITRFTDDLNQMNMFYIGTLPSFVLSLIHI